MNDFLCSQSGSALLGLDVKMTTCTFRTRNYKVELIAWSELVSPEASVITCSLPIVVTRWSYSS